MVEPDNLILVQLREMRAEIAAQFAAVDARFDKIERRLEIMHSNGEKALRQFIGHRAMVERTMGSFQVDVRALERRVELLEASRG